MAVVIIITILAALASPILIRQWRERRGQHAASQVAQVFLQARMRALAKGAAVKVTWRKDTGFVVEEATEGPVAATARGYATCAEGPGLGCLSNDWTDATTKRLVERYDTDKYALVTGKNGAGAAITQMDLCFNPLGRSFASFDGTKPTTPLASTPTFDIQRIDNEGGTFVARGQVRTVVLLPNGMARLAL